MSFEMWLLALVCSPAYFLVQKRWAAFIFNSMLYGMALLLLITIIGAFLAPAFWIIGFIHAAWDMRSVITAKAMRRQAEMIAEEMHKSNMPSNQ